MKSTDDLKRLIDERGVRRHERQEILRTLAEDNPPTKLQARMDTALANVRAQATRLRKALE